MARVSLNRQKVRPVHHAAEVNIVAEVAAIDRLPSIRVDLALVRHVNNAIAINVAREEAKRHVTMR